MKKTLIIILVIVMVSLSACSKDNNDQQSSQSKNNSSSSESSTKTNYSLVDTWGVKYRSPYENAKYEINFPEAIGIQKYTGLLISSDDVTIILDQEIKENTQDFNVDVKKIKTNSDILKVFTPIFLKITDTTNLSKNDKNVDITEQKEVKINNYSFCVSKGTLNYEDFGTTGITKRNILSYATFLSTGSPVYFVFIDQSANQSKGSYIEENAKKMAETLREYTGNYTGN